jgi:hypothetical protein
MKNIKITFLGLFLLSSSSCTTTERQQQQLIFVNKLTEPIQVSLFAKKDMVKLNMYRSSTFNNETYQLSNLTLQPNEEYSFYLFANNTSKPNIVFATVFDSLKIKTSVHSVVFKPNLATNYLYNIYEINEGWTYKVENYTQPKQFTKDVVISDNYYFTFKDNFFK